MHWRSRIFHILVLIFWIGYEPALAQSIAADADIDKANAHRLVLAEAAYGIAEKNNSGLLYAAVNLNGVTTPARLIAVLKEAASKGNAEEVLNGDQVFSLIKLGLSIRGGGPL